jgi:hypothetical protein
MAPANSNEIACYFTLASDVTAGGLPSEGEIAKDLESSDAGYVFVFGQSFSLPNSVILAFWGVALPA